MIHLPGDILTDILLRLPFESILGCKLVSKQWNNFLKDPEFLQVYRDKNHTSCTTSLFMSKGNLYCLIKHVENLERPINGGPPDPLRLHQIPLDRYRYRNLKNKKKGQTFPDGDPQLLSGSSSSVACVKFSDGHFSLYNLFTGSRYATVEDSPLKQHSSESWLSYGFGYDSYECDYKIMLVVKHRFDKNPLGQGWVRIGKNKKKELTLDMVNAVQNEENSLFWVYGFKSRRWKPFKGFPYDAYDWSSSSSSYSFNGILNWVVDRKGDDRKEVIVTYDLHTDRFGEIPMPTQAAYTKTLGELNGQLRLVYEMPFEVDLWVMKEYGVGDSWEKLLSIGNYRQGSSEYWRTYRHEDSGKHVLYVSRYLATLYWDDIDDWIEADRRYGKITRWM